MLVALHEDASLSHKSHIWRKYILGKDNLEDSSTGTFVIHSTLFSFLRQTFEYMNNERVVRNVAFNTFIVDTYRQQVLEKCLQKCCALTDMRSRSFEFE